MKTRIRIESSWWFTEYYTEKYDIMFGWVRMHWCSFRTMEDAKYAVDVFLKENAQHEKYIKHQQEFITTYEEYPK